MNDCVKQWQNQLQAVAKPEKVKILSSFFKTGKGQYGEGDIFIGVTVPNNRKIAIAHHHLPLDIIDKMLHHKVHEYRLSALLALVARFKKAKQESRQSEIVNYYLQNTACINNWDLVDLSAPGILGNYQLAHREIDLLTPLSHSSSLWDKRIAIVSTITLIKASQFAPTLHFAQAMKNEKEDLLHKAVGWMLREVGKKDLDVLRRFLDNHATTLPRTTLRYAIERMSTDERKHYMKKQ